MRGIDWRETSGCGGRPDVVGRGYIWVRLSASLVLCRGRRRSGS